MNIYRHTFVARCPSDGEMIIYRMEIKTKGMVMVEHIKTATSLIKEGYQEQIADQLQQQLGGVLRIEATHQGVEIESIRGVP
ncbi:hypothetical protein [Pseudomonas sp. PDM13]|uniref:hypothetical protein n=1 Tax=Pseudomonas sp. PDM13 TaxID=2769255 RepID=UPI0021DF74A9|nr:hypothetical protein [Pseudomonas sp. PDM13]MCU9949816.1 hypothetical protein [Pseudomonas sp. PDM13]